MSELQQSRCQNACRCEDCAACIEAPEPMFPNVTRGIAELPETITQHGEVPTWMVVLSIIALVILVVIMIVTKTPPPKALG